MALAAVGAYRVSQLSVELPFIRGQFERFKIGFYFNGDVETAMVFDPRYSVLLRRVFEKQSFMRVDSKVLILYLVL